MKIDTKKIKELLSSGVTGYRIGKETNVKQQTFDKYKNGKSDIEDMPLKTAMELQKFINQEESKMETARILELDKKELEKLREILDKKGFNMESWELVLEDDLDNIGKYLLNTEYYLNGLTWEIEKRK